MVTDHVGNLVCDGQVIGHLLAIFMQGRPASETVGLHRAVLAPAAPEIPFPVSALSTTWLHICRLVRFAACDTESGGRTAYFCCPAPGSCTASIPNLSSLRLREYLLKLKGDQPAQIGKRCGAGNRIGSELDTAMSVPCRMVLPIVAIPPPAERRRSVFDCGLGGLQDEDLVPILVVLLDVDQQRQHRGKLTRLPPRAKLGVHDQPGL